VRLRTLFVALSSSLTVAACATAPALASTATGGAAVESPSSSSSSSTTTSTTTTTTVAGGATPTAPAHHAPITAKTPNIAYNGPVYEKSATGQVIPYDPPPTAASGEASSASVRGISTDSAASDTATGTGTSTTSTTTTGGSSPVTTAPGVSTGTTGSGPTMTNPELLVPGHTARIIDGIAAAPIDAPLAVQEIIWAGNQIVGLPYIYGGGHGSFISPGYDCSGTVSYALHGASLLTTPMDSTEFEGWGGGGVGTWVTIFANGGHAYMTVAGIRLDTSPANDPSNLPGPRWRPLRPENAGFVVRHPVGL